MKPSQNTAHLSGTLATPEAQKMLARIAVVNPGLLVAAKTNPEVRNMLERVVPITTSGS